VGALFEQLKQEAEHVLKVNVRTAAPIGAAATARLRDALKRRFGRDIELQETIDESMIGGAVIDTGDIVIDGSVRGRLGRLEAGLADGARHRNTTGSGRCPRTSKENHSACDCPRSA